MLCLTLLACFPDLDAWSGAVDTDAGVGEDEGGDGGVDTGPGRDTAPDTGGPGPDSDGDGYPASQDCDDANAEVYPGNGEAFNTIDDDCDDVVDEGFLYGDLLMITELMPAPKGGEPEQEWFEIYNTSGDLLVLDGLELVSACGGDFFVAPERLEIPPTSHVVFCHHDDVLGADCDYVYGDAPHAGSAAGLTSDPGFCLDNADTLSLVHAGVTIDTVTWRDGSSGWLSTEEGSTLGLSPKGYEYWGNSSGAVWCYASVEDLYDSANDNYGTPGAALADCFESTPEEQSDEDDD